MFASLRIQLVCFLLFALTLVSANKELNGYDIDLDDGTTFTPAVHKLVARQSTLTTLCSPLTVNLVQNGVTTGNIRPRTCYCNYQGTLTPATVSDIDQAFATTSAQINQTNFNSYLTTNGFTRAQGIANIKSGIQSGLNTKTTTCVYGAGAVPNSCDTCTFTCSTSTTKRCGTACIASTATCASGLAQKRDFDRRRCPSGYEVCETGLKGLGSKSGGWECVNTQADLESCGGCQNPMEGRSAGVDCTAIVGMAGVACVSGTCEVSSCIKGYKLENNACVPVTRSASSAAASSASALAVKRAAAADVDERDFIPGVPASIGIEKRYTEESKPTEKGKHKVWHKRAKQPTKNQRRR